MARLRFSKNTVHRPACRKGTSISSWSPFITPELILALLKESTFSQKLEIQHLWHGIHLSTFHWFCLYEKIPFTQKFSHLSPHTHTNNPPDTHHHVCICTQSLCKPTCPPTQTHPHIYPHHLVHKTPQHTHPHHQAHLHAHIAPVHKAPLTTKQKELKRNHILAFMQNSSRFKGIVHKTLYKHHMHILKSCGREFWVKSFSLSKP